MMRLVWSLWLAFFVSSFAAFEWWALSHDNGLSLSQYTVDALYAWPPLGFLLGLLVGILVTHFFWPWVPKQLRVICGECGKTILIDHKKG